MTPLYVNRSASDCVARIIDAARTKQMCWYLYSYFLYFNNIQNNFIDYYVSAEGENEKSKLFIKVSYALWNGKNKLTKQADEDERKKVCKETSAIVLQSAVRTYLAREKYLRMKEESKARHSSVTKLQNWMRILLAKKQFEVRKLKRNSTQRHYYHVGQYILDNNWNLIQNLQESIDEKRMPLSIVEGTENMSNLTYANDEFDHGQFDRGQEELGSEYTDIEGVDSCIRWRTILVGSIDNVKFTHGKSLMTGSIEIKLK